jgi:hypothetical protein
VALDPVLDRSGGDAGVPRDRSDYPLKEGRRMHGRSERYRPERIGHGLKNMAIVARTLEVMPSTPCARCGVKFESHHQGGCTRWTEGRLRT